MTHAVPPLTLEQFHQKERTLDVLGPETKILIKTPGLLIIQVDMEELPRLECLPNNVTVVETWSKGFGGSDNDAGNGVAVDGGGDVVVTGYFKTTVNFGGGNLTSSGLDDIFVAKVSGTDGSHVWARGFGNICIQYFWTKLSSYGISWSAYSYRWRNSS